MEVQYPFGHGLSYTTFDYQNLRVEGARVFFDLTNSGKVEGKEVVQVYLAARGSRIERPLRELKGFEKCTLAPDETKTLSFEIDPQAFCYYSEEVND